MLQLLIGISERDHWGTRVTKTIPAGLPARVPAFLFYSGAAGGILLGLIMVGGSLLVPYAFEEWSTSLTRPRARDVIYETAVVIALYAVAYILTSALVRQLLGPRFKPHSTWVLALVLFGLGMALPTVISYNFFADRLRYHQPQEYTWWLLPNPFVAITEMNLSAGMRGPFESMPLRFTAVWAAAAFLLNVPWFLRQARAFKPPEEVLAAVPVEELDARRREYVR